MADKRKNHIVKRVKIDNKQWKQLYAVLTAYDDIGDIAAAMLSRLLIEHRKRVADCWDSAARIAGYDNSAAVHADGKSLRLDFTSCEVLIEEPKPEGGIR